MNSLMPCFVVGLAFWCSSCAAVDDTTAPGAPDDPASQPASVAPVSAGSARPSGTGAAPAGTGAAPDRSRPDSDVPGWLSGHQQGKLDASRGLSQNPERYEFIYSAADQAGFFRGYEEGYHQFKK